MRNVFVKASIGVAAILIVAGIVFAGGVGEDRQLRDLPDFSAVHFSIPGHVEVITGAGPSVSVAGPASAADVVDIYVRDGVLHIESRGWRIGRSLDRLVFTVTTPEITELAAESSGSIHAERLSGDEVRLVSSSSGSIVIDALTADRARVVLSSSGSITANGSVRQLDLRVSSSGRFHGRALQAQDADVVLSSSGDAHVAVRGSLSGRVSSSGDLHYYGDPASIRVTTSSSGDIHREK